MSALKRVRKYLHAVSQKRKKPERPGIHSPEKEAEIEARRKVGSVETTSVNISFLKGILVSRPYEVLSIVTSIVCGQTAIKMARLGTCQIHVKQRHSHRYQTNILFRMFLVNMIYLFVFRVKF